MSLLATEASSAEAALRRSTIPVLRRINVRETDKFIILTGRVRTYYQKQLAQQAVMPYLAGRRLVNRVVVLRP